MIPELLVSFAFMLLAQPTRVEKSDLLALSTLQPGCRVSRGSLRLVIPSTPVAWLECGEYKVLVNHPNNFVEKVRIQSESQALEYVRFFTSPETFDLFELEGIVELVPSKKAVGGGVNAVEEADFEKYLKPPVVRSIRGGAMAEFSVVRYVVALDQKAYEVVESVWENGYYSVLSRRFVVDAEKIGVVHLGHI